MELKQILLTIEQLARQNRIHRPYIVGGLVRDKVIGLPVKLGDIDITTGHHDAKRLAKIVASHFVNEYPDLKYKESPEGHIDLAFGGIDYDFSSHRVHPLVPILLKRIDMKPNSFLLENMSRDFTINTLLLTMDLKNVKDPTGMGLRDIKRKLIRSVIPPRYSIRTNTYHIIRAIYMAAKLNFDVEEDIIKWVIRNPNLVHDISGTYIKDKLGKAFRLNPGKTTELMDKMKLWGHIPMIKEILPYAKGRL